MKNAYQPANEAQLELITTEVLMTDGSDYICYWTTIAQAKQYLQSLLDAGMIKQYKAYDNVSGVPVISQLQPLKNKKLIHHPGRARYTRRIEATMPLIDRQILSLYEAGYTVSQIALRVNRVVSFVTGVLSKYEVAA